MKKLYPLILFFTFSLPALLAQVPDRTVVDCNNASSSIYSELASGKVLLVASEGFDCSVCKSKAPALQSWAAQNKANVKVWGAMTNTYSSTTPSCANLQNWVNNYQWNDIFTFIDSSKHWFASGTPRFTVYDPSDSSIAYQGFDETAAKNKAVELAGAPMSNMVMNGKEFYIASENGLIRFYNLPAGRNEVQLSNLTGRLVRTKSLNGGSENYNLNINGLTPGIYLVSVQNNSGFKTVRKIYLN